MNYLFHASSHTAAIFLKTSHFIARNSLYGCSTSSWKRSLKHSGIRTINLELVFARFRVQCYSSRRVSGSKSRSRKLDPKPVMEEEKDAFYVVRKGDVVGIYKNLSDCQAQVGSSICDPPVSVYKGYSMPNDAEEYLVSRGLKNALYTIRAGDLQEDIFGMLVPCPFQQPDSSYGETSSKDVPKKRSAEELGLEIVEPVGSDPLRKHIKLDGDVESQALSSDCRSCILEFDGASKGNPGQAGAGAVLRAVNGSLICKLREGLGIATNNVAEYRAMILGLRNALQRGCKDIQVQGDSKLVCMQVQGLWKVKNQNMSDLCDEAKKLKDKFESFQINHVLRGLNSEADAQANLAISLAEGQVQEELVNELC